MPDNEPASATDGRFRLVRGHLAGCPVGSAIRAGARRAMAATPSGGDVDR